MAGTVSVSPVMLPLTILVILAWKVDGEGCRPARRRAAPGDAGQVARRGAGGAVPDDPGGAVYLGVLALLAVVTNRRMLNRIAHAYLQRKHQVKAVIGAATILLGLVILITA